ncbi:MAG: YolD-like family protein [Bacilli bacterium]|jgi:hypothetical protein|nr:YolD-like family protein [Bacilli bacterium]
MNERGMKKWRPFAALPQYKDYYKDMLEERKKVPKPLISEDQAEEIGMVLGKLVKGDRISLSYFNNGRILSYEGEFIKLDIASRLLFASELSLSFDNLLKIRQN